MKFLIGSKNEIINLDIIACISYKKTGDGDNQFFIFALLNDSESSCVTIAKTNGRNKQSSLKQTEDILFEIMETIQDSKKDDTFICPDYKKITS